MARAKSLRQKNPVPACNIVPPGKYYLALVLLLAELMLAIEIRMTHAVAVITPQQRYGPFPTW